MSSTVIPTLRYKDDKAAIDFLTSAFGFTAEAVHEGDGDTIAHAQLVHGAGMIMLGTDSEDDWAANVTTPESTSRPAGAVYVIVDDVHAHADAARAAGAEIIMEPEAQDYGGHNYSAKDPEGYIWSFGDYDPWADDA